MAADLHKRRTLRDEAFRLLVDAVDDYAIFMLDSRGIIQSWNRGAQRIKGYSESEAIGRHFSMFYTPDDLASQKPKRELEIAAATGKYEEEGFRVRKDGSRFWANVLITALRDNTGVYGYAKVTRDLTERRLAQERLLEERAGRARAEERAERAGLVAELSRALASGTKTGETLQRVADLLAHHLADQAVVELRGLEGEEARVAESHRGEALPLDATAVAQVLASGQPMLHAPLDPHSYVIVPLTAGPGARVTGTLSLVCARRSYDESDLELALDIAQRAWLGIENARLHEHEKAALARADELRLRLEAVLRQMPAAVIIVDAQGGRPIMVNREYQRIVGHASPEVTLHDADGVPLPPERAPLQRAWRHGESVTGLELMLVRSDGSRAWIVCNAAPIYDPHSGAVIAGICAFDEVSERKRAVERLSALASAGAVLSVSLDVDATLRELAHAVIPALGDWCSIEMADEHGRLTPLVVVHTDPEKTRWVQALVGRWPAPPDAPRGSPHVVRTRQPELYAEITDELLVQAAHDPEHLSMLRRVGMTSALIVPIAWKDACYGALTLISAESRRHYDQSDVDVAVELARRAGMAIENARLFAATRRSEKEAREAVNARDEFMSVAAHELRTPLAALRLANESLARLITRRPPDLPERAAAKTSSNVKQIERLSVLVSQLLDVSRLAEGRPLDLVPEDLDLATLVREVAARFEELAAGSSLTVEAAAPVRGRWDRSRLDQVLTNLLSNALKYGRKRPITLTVAAQNGRAVVGVRDQGIGIAEGDQARIFERFERAAPDVNVSGLGLGLWITRRMVEAMGGTISVASQPGEGSTFTVELPL